MNAVPTRLEQLLTPRVRFALDEQEDIDLKAKYSKGLRRYKKAMGFVSNALPC